MFRGSYDAKITEGRLKMPTDFEKLLRAAKIDQFYITSVDGKSAEIWPLPEWEKREAKLAEYSTLDDAVQKYLSWTSYYGQQVEIDKQARLSLPKTLREAAKLEGEVRVMGKIGYMEVANLQTLQETLTSSAMTADDRAHVAGMLVSQKATVIP
jgi:MraZ protein